MCNRRDLHRPPGKICSGGLYSLGSKVYCCKYLRTPTIFTCGIICYSGEDHPFCPGKIQIMGDFNTTMTPDLDRPTPSKKHSMELSTWAQAMGLAEIWRWKHPTTRSFSCFSASHKTASHIDLAFSNLSLMADVLEASYLTSGLSDNSPLAVVFRSPASRSTALWRLGPTGSPIQTLQINYRLY